MMLPPPAARGSKGRRDASCDSNAARAALPIEAATWVNRWGGGNSLQDVGGRAGRPQAIFMFPRDSARSSRVAVRRRVPQDDLVLSNRMPGAETQFLYTRTGLNLLKPWRKNGPMLILPMCVSVALFGQNPFPWPSVSPCPALTRFLSLGLLLHESLNETLSFRDAGFLAAPDLQSCATFPSRSSSKRLSKCSRRGTNGTRPVSPTCLGGLLTAISTTRSFRPMPGGAPGSKAPVPTSRFAWRTQGNLPTPAATNCRSVA